MARGVEIKAALITRAAYAAVAKIREIGEDQSGLFEIWGNILEGSVKNRFEVGRGPGGVPWIPSKRVIKNGGTTLKDKNVLENSLRYEVTSRQLIIGFDANASKSRHPVAHQFGFSGTSEVGPSTRMITSAFGIPLKSPKRVSVRAHSRKGNLPARPMLGIDNNDRRDLTEAAQEYVRGLLE